MPWGSVGGQDVSLVTLRSESLEVDVSSLGAALVAVRLKVAGDWLDVLLGYEAAERYPAQAGSGGAGKPNFGTVVGRCCNRIANGQFELDGVGYQLDQNNGVNHLHGGVDGFHARHFTVADSSDTSVTLRLTEPDGAMGYPGTVELSVAYEVQGGELHFRYAGTTDKPTLLSLTNHGYWNLKGHQAGDVLDHSLTVCGSRTTAVDESLIITGELRPVDGTPLDLRGSAPARLLRDAVDEGGPIDVNYCLDRPEGSSEAMLAAQLKAPNGVSMSVWTDQPGLQVFTGQNIDAENAAWWRGKGATWQRCGAVCLEPQLWPDGVHHGHFPSPVLRPGEKYTHHSWHVFAVEA